MNTSKEKYLKMHNFKIQEHLVWQNKRQSKEEVFVGCSLLYSVESFTTKQSDLLLDLPH